MNIQTAPLVSLPQQGLLMPHARTAVRFSCIMQVKLLVLRWVNEWFWWPIRMKSWWWHWCVAANSRSRPIYFWCHSIWWDSVPEDQRRQAVCWCADGSGMCETCRVAKQGAFWEHSWFFSPGLGFCSMITKDACRACVKTFLVAIVTIHIPIDWQAWYPWRSSVF